MWVVAQHLIQLSGVPLDRLMKWSSLSAPWLTVGEAVAVISDVAGHPMKWKAGIARHGEFKLTYADRQVLRITTIGAIDFNASKRKAKRRIQRRNWNEHGEKLNEIKHVCRGHHSMVLYGHGLAEFSVSNQPPSPSLIRGAPQATRPEAASSVVSAIMTTAEQERVVTELRRAAAPPQTLPAIALPRDSRQSAEQSLYQRH